MLLNHEEIRGWRYVLECFEEQVRTGKIGEWEMMEGRSIHGSIGGMCDVISCLHDLGLIDDKTCDIMELRIKELPYIGLPCPWSEYKFPVNTEGNIKRVEWIKDMIRRLEDENEKTKKKEM